MEPNKENIRLLVAALRSGEFEQTRSTLTRIYDNGTTKNCCLGVACHVARANGVNINLGRATDLLDGSNEPEIGVWYQDLPPAREGHTWSRSVMPTGVQEFYGINSNPSLEHPEHPADQIASYFNDTVHWDFNKIADAFEYTFLREDWNARQNNE
jgi:hypothetical protein